MSDKRSWTGLHRNYKKPELLLSFLNDLKPTQVQMNHGRTIKRGILVGIPEIDHIGRRVTVTISELFETTSQNKESVQWSKVELAQRTALVTTERSRSTFTWDDEEGKSGIYPTTTRVTLSFMCFYRSRDHGRIKISGVGHHYWLRRIRKSDFWRFFGNNDPTNLIIGNDGTVSQKETII